MNTLDKIQSCFENFTKTEQEIAIYIINHPKNISSFTVSK